MDTSIKKFITTLPQDQKEMFIMLREIVLGTYPAFEEKFGFGVPYYYIKKKVCFIWPTAIPRSGLNGGVLLGFCNGVILKKKFDIISCGSNKVVGWIQYHHMKEIKVRIIKEILVEAIMFQEIQNSI